MEDNIKTKEAVRLKVRVDACKSHLRRDGQRNKGLEGRDGIELECGNKEYEKV